jgi:hypothetical protein
LSSIPAKENPAIPPSKANAVPTCETQDPLGIKSCAQNTKIAEIDTMLNSRIAKMVAPSPVDPKIDATISDSDVFLPNRRKASE